MLLTLTEKILDKCFATIPRQTPDAERINKTRLIAHRGAHNNRMGIFENTHAAFRLAKKVNCWGIELDVHATADKVLVVNHDATLHRLWGQNVVIKDVTFKALRALVPALPSLAEVVAEYGKQMHLFIELKSPFHDEDALAEILHDLSPAIDYHLLTLDALTFSTWSQFPKHSLLLVAAHNNVQKFCKISFKEHYGGVMGHYFLLTNTHIRQLTAAHQLSGVGLVNSKNSLYRELNRGVDWIFTNQAVKISHYLL